MAEQILSHLGNFVGWNIYAMALIPLAARRPKVARFMLSILFLGGAPWNLFASLAMPQFYVETYGPVATPPYAAFIYGPFAANPALFVVPIAFGELAIGVLTAARGTWVGLGMVGVMVFMVGLAPLGVGGAFPFSVFAIAAAYVLFRTRFDTSLPEDVARAWTAVSRPPWPRGHAGPHA
jgi:hypothetical protein